MDGVPVSDQFDVGSFSNATRDLVSAGFVEHIEVLHGPASALYGSSAIGGVVAMQTVDPVLRTGRPGQAGRFAGSWRGDDSSVQATALQGIAGDGYSVAAGIYGHAGEQADAAAVEENIDLRDFESHAGLLKIAVDDPLGNTLQANLHVRDGSVRSELRRASLVLSSRQNSVLSLPVDRGRERVTVNLYTPALSTHRAARHRGGAGRPDGLHGARPRPGRAARHLHRR